MNSLIRPNDPGLPRDWDEGTIRDAVRSVDIAWTRLLVVAGFGKFRKWVWSLGKSR